MYGELHRNIQKKLTDKKMKPLIIFVYIWMLVQCKYEVLWSLFSLIFLEDINGPQ